MKVSKKDFKNDFNVKISINSEENDQGKVTIFRLQYKVFIIFRNDKCKEKEIIISEHSITPLTDPYKFIDGYFLFDLSYYSNITVIPKQSRICFYDFNQDIGIVVEFDSSEGYNNFFNNLFNVVTIVSKELIGFYDIVSLSPSYYPNEVYYRVRKDLQSHFLSTYKTPQKNKLIMDHTQIILQISPKDSSEAIKTEKDISNSFSTYEAMRDYVLHHKIPRKRKAEVWCFLVGIDLNHIQQQFIDEYKSVKRQWTTLSISQFNRSNRLQNNYRTLYNVISKSRFNLITIVRDQNICNITFNIIMCLCQTYYFLYDKYNELISILRVFYSIFIQDVEYNNEDAKNYYVVTDNIKLNQENLEIIIFWSMIKLIERAELIQIFEENSSANIVEDFFFLAHPLAFHEIVTTDLKAFESLNYTMSVLLSDLLPLCDCADVWIMALSSLNFRLYISCYVIAHILWYYTKNPELKLIKILENGFNANEHSYMQVIAMNLLKQFKKMVNNGQRLNNVKM